MTDLVWDNVTLEDKEQEAMKVNVSLVQDSPAFFDKEATLRKIEDVTLEQAQHGCDLIVFPESFVPGYPRGFTFGASIGRRTDEGRKQYAEFHANSFDTQGEEMKRLEELARKCDIFMIVGVSEKNQTNGSLYCSSLYISPSNGLMGIHRKIKPTGTERLIWAEADGSSLVTFRTRIGKLGGLICWENYMPLARMSMYSKGVEIYVAPTADARDEWTSTMRQIALEGRCFVLGCNQYFTKSMYPEKHQHLVESAPEVMCRGGSVIISPLGKVLAGPLYDKEGVLTAQLDLDEIQEGKLDFDVVGHYARNDIFTFFTRDQPETFDDIISE